MIGGIISDNTGRVRVAEVHRLLFADKSLDAANRALARLRSRVEEVAEEAGVVLSLCVSEARSVGAEARDLWFEGAGFALEGMNRTEDLERVGDELIEDIRGKPLRVSEPRLRLCEFSGGKPIVRVFVSYAHKDAKPSNKLKSALEDSLRCSPTYAFELWQDVDLLPGEGWDAAIRAALAEAHVGLLLLSPAFFASEYIKNAELPALVSGRGEGVEGKRVVPVELRKIDFGRTDMHGLSRRQVFRGPFSTRAGPKQDSWVRALVDQIHRVLDKYADPDPPPPDGPRLRAQHMLSRDLDQIHCLIEDAGARVARLDASVLDEHDPSARESVRAIDYILEWLRDPSGSDLFALLGEYGMGKTVTCQRLTRAVEQIGEGEGLPAPFYFDLRRLTSLRSRAAVPLLHEIMDECIERGWTLADADERSTAKALFEQARERPVLFVFDGLDEALVHLDEAQGKEFTRELLRVRELGEAKGVKNRVLLSCRTHYFRSIKEQDAHFTGQDRGRTIAQDYTAIILVPFSQAQIRTYLATAIPDLDVERAIELVASVHNLGQLAERPYTLRLISEQIPAIERIRAQGKAVYGVTLYGLMVEKWLTRDGGKHHIKPDHKRRLMSHLAAWTWARGARLVPATELEDWFAAWLASDPVMQRRYGAVNMDKLEEDLRTATFLVREDGEGDEAGGFRFAHTSMQEFFLSRFLFDALVDDAPERWSLDDVSRETWDFFAQTLVEQGRTELVGRLSEWARGDRRAPRWLVFRYVLAGHERGWPAPSVVGVDLSGIDLQGQGIRGPLDLSGTRWHGAQLRQVQWENLKLDDAEFVGADLRFGEWNEVQADRASFEHARLDGGVFRRVSWAGARWAQASGRRCSFIQTCPAGFDAGEGEGARVAPLAASLGAPGLVGKAVELGEWGHAHALAWSPDGKQALSAGDDGSVRLWDVASGTGLAVWAGHRGGVLSCAWSPDGKQALSAGDDGSVRLWDVASGTGLAVWEGHRGGVRSCAWSPDGKQALSAGDDGTLRVWDVASGTSQLIIAIKHQSHAIFTPGPDARILEASQDAWRWLRWQVRYQDGTTELLPAETFGELPCPAQLRATQSSPGPQSRRSNH